MTSRSVGSVHDRKGLYHQAFSTVSPLHLDNPRPQQLHETRFTPE